MINVVGVEGDLIGMDKVVWIYDKDMFYVVLLLFYNGYFYFFKVIINIFIVFDVSNGEFFYNECFSDFVNVYVLFVGVVGCVYFIGCKGKLMVFDVGKEFKVLVMNMLDDCFDVLLVVFGDWLYLCG